MDQWKRTESRNRLIHIYIYGPMTFNRDAKALDGKRIVFATNDAKQLNF